MDWLNLEIKKQKKQRKIIEYFLGKDPGSIQEMAERENWDKPKRRKRR
jgi:hypothetical protein